MIGRTAKYFCKGFNKMKLAILSTGFVPIPAVRGGEVERLTEYFILGNEVTHKYDIDLYTIDDELLNNKHYKYTRLIRIPNNQNNIFQRVYYGLKNRLFRLLGNEDFFYYGASQIIKKYKTNYYDKVLIENSMDLYLQLLPKIKNEKLYFHLHNDFNDNDLGKTNKKTKRVLQTCTKFFVVSNFLKEKLRKLDPTLINKVNVIYNGIISNNFKKLSKEERMIERSKYNIKKEDKVFTYIGTVSSPKGPDKIIKALKYFIDYSNIKVLIVGSLTYDNDDINDYVSEIRKEAKKYPDKVIFTGYIKNQELNKIYSISDCVIVPTQIEETFGVVALEAITMGIPVIASVSGGLTEVLNKNCALFVNRDKFYVKNLSNAMFKILKNPKLCESMEVGGKKQSEKFPKNIRGYYDELADNL